MPHNKCFRNKSYKGRRPRSICNKLEINFKPHSKFSAELGGWPESDEWWCGGSLDTEKDEKKDDGWILVTKGFKPELKKPVTTYTNNAFSLLSVNDNPEKNTPQLQTNALSTSDKQPPKQNNKRSQREIIQQHQRDTLKQLRESKELFFDECIT